ncbi:MAG: pyridoxal phosphate-dependent aminotransferase [Alphaproteobacteria bacterium]
MKQTLATGPSGARAHADALRGSQIREVANAGMGLADVIALWYGEPDLPTPDFICQAAAEALARGDTFYTENLGVPALRETLARYMSRLYGRDLGPERIAVTASGMSGVNLVQQVLVDPGDNVVVVGPLWPNMVEAVHLMRGETRIVPLQFGNDGWRLDLQRVLDNIDGQTRAVLVNSPSNPTGWVMERDAQQALLDACRERGVWILSDEVYTRLIYDRPVAPSFIEIAEPEDRVIAINSFSKTWAMTGWRLGWLAAPTSLMGTLEKCIEYHYSCPAHFSQTAGIVAIEQGEPSVREMVARYHAARDLAVDRLQAMRGVRLHRPAGAFYAFAKVEGMTDSLAFCKRAVREARVGLAPGSAFGPEGEGFFRLCFASTLPRLAEAMDRLAPLLDE